MRINKYVASASSLSRRAADAAIAGGRIQINGQPASAGQDVNGQDRVTFDSRVITPAVNTTTIMLNKPVGYVVSRNGQGAPTIYDLLPPGLQHLQPVGRLDKDSSGLLLLTTNGQLAQQLTHPSQQKQKVYEVALDKTLPAATQQQLTEQGVKLDDGISTFDSLSQLQGRNQWQIVMHEGRNRQIRRTFTELGFRVDSLHRTGFGEYELLDMPRSTYKIIK